MNIFESAFPQQGERATETSHRKIELQSPADLTYLVGKVSTVAREKLDKHLPPNAAADSDASDPMRRKVEELVDDYVRNTFEMAKDGIAVNGMNAKEMRWEGWEQEGEWISFSRIYRRGLWSVWSGKANVRESELEPFNPKLAQKIQSLSAQIERETLYLANKRRKAPQETAQKFLESFDKQAKEGDEKLLADQEAKVKAAGETTVDVGRVERVEEMQGTWQRGREELAGLKAGMVGTVERMERAQRAVEVVEK